MPQSLTLSSTHANMYVCVSVCVCVLETRVMANTCNPSISEMEARKSEVQSHPQLYSLGVHATLQGRKKKRGRETERGGGKRREEGIEREDSQPLKKRYSPSYPQGQILSKGKEN